MQAIDTQDKQFHDGNGTTELGTILPAWWLNQIQAEILAVLTAAKVSPNKAKTSQLAEAIGKLLTGSVVDNLTSTNTDKPLSAKQGKTLSEQITAAISGSLNLRGSLGARNLNDVFGVSNYGVWDNSANTNATTDKNYPTTKAGTLFVLPSAYQGIQLYIPFEQNLIYIRHTNTNNNPAIFSTWRTIGGNVIDGVLKINNPNAWAAIQFQTQSGYWQLETNPKGNSETGGMRLGYVFRGADGAVKSNIMFPEQIGSTNVAYQSWVNAQIDEKSTLKTINYAENVSVGYAKTGFYRGDRVKINNINTPAMEMHITHPNSANNAYARGIGFEYGGDFGLSTTAWDGNGAYLGQKVILTELNGVMKTALSNAINSTSSSTVATSAAVKTAYDKAVAAESSLKNALPSGIIAYFAGAHQPTGWLKCNGAAVSRTTYAGIFAAIGTTYGAGDGSTTFNLPDLRGEFIRGFDDGRKVDAGRVLGSAQGDAIRNITGSIRQVIDADVSGGNESTTGALTLTDAVITGATEHDATGKRHRGIALDASLVVPTATENRPRNIALLACIKI